MPRYICFLRALNVGGHVVKMEELRTLFQDLGFANVETFIASGNVIFESKIPDATSLERKIEEHLYKSLGYEVAAFIRTREEVAALARYKPFVEADPALTPTVVVGFLKSKLAPSSEKLLASLTSDIDILGTRGRELFWLSRNKQSESIFSNAVFEKKLSLKTTFRGFSTIVKLSLKYPAGGNGS